MWSWSSNRFPRRSNDSWIVSIACFNSGLALRHHVSSVLSTYPKVPLCNLLRTRPLRSEWDGEEHGQLFSLKLSLISFVILLIDECSRTYDRMQGTCRKWCYLRRHHEAAHHETSSQDAHTLDKPLAWAPRCPCRPQTELGCRSAYHEVSKGMLRGHLLSFERLAICLLMSVSYKKWTKDKVSY